MPPRPQELKKQHPKVLQEMIMDIMRALGTGVGSNIEAALRLSLASKRCVTTRSLGEP